MTTTSSGSEAPRTASRVYTDFLELHYLDSGPRDGPVAVLLHGWPDDPHTWTAVSDHLNTAGWRTIAPYLRGFGPNRFLSEETPRSGQLTALASDVLALADQLALTQFSVIGHDWGARTAYILAAQAPERISHCIALSVGYGAISELPLQQVHQFWYQWFFALPQGEAALRADRRELCRYLWSTWSPSWEFAASELERTATAFENPDWIQVTLHGYRHRWGLAAADLHYAALEARQATTPRITVPTLVLHGEDDRCILPGNSLGREQSFAGAYSRVGLAGVGHFPQREASGLVADIALRWLREQRPIAAVA